MVTKKRQIKRLDKRQVAISKGYEKAKGVRPTNEILESLTDSQLRRYAKLGSKKRKRLMWVGLIVLLISSVLSAYVYAKYINKTPVENKRPQAEDMGSVKAGDTQTSQPNIEKKTNETTNTSSPRSKGYVPGVCTKTIISSKTVYEDASWLDAGKTYTSVTGRDGYVETCTPDSIGYTRPPHTLSAIDTVITRGTKVTTPTPPPQPTYTYSQVMVIAQQQCAQYSGSSAYTQCINAVLNQYGY